jgi:hypothetical protein
MKKLVLLFLITTCINNSLQAQMITKIAGGNGCGSSSCGDGGQATFAGLNNPAGVFVDAAGNIYIADQFNNKVRKVNTAGIITTIAGNGTSGYTGDGGAATAAEMSSPADVAVDAAGNVYIADENNARIRKVTTGGIITSFAVPTSIYGALGMDIDAAGNIYLANGGGKVYKISSTGAITTIAGSGTGSGTTGFTGDGGTAIAATLNTPYDVAIDRNNGNVYIADYTNNRIRKVNSLGIISTFAGTGATGMAGDGGQATAAQIQEPYGVAVDQSGNVYVSTNYFNQSKVRKINTAGIITSYAGTGPSVYSGVPGLAVNAELDGPNRLCIDAVGNLYMADLNYILKVCNQTDSVAGFVKDALNNPITAGTVYAFKKQVAHPGLLDTIGFVSITSNGFYKFPNMYGNNYLVKAYPDITLYPNAVPTYYGTRNILYRWDSAGVIAFDPCSISALNGDNIVVETFTPQTGNGIISGNVSTLPGFGHRLANGGNNSVMGVPIKGVDIKLGKNPAGGCVNRTTSDVNGNYSFTNVDVGSYFVYVDIPNFIDTLANINVTSINTTFTNVNYCVDSVKIHLCGNILAGVSTYNTQHSIVQLYPNPAQNNFTVEVSTSEKQTLQIFDVTGKLVLIQTLNGTTNVDASNLNAGVYNVSITSSGTGTANKRLVIVK